MNLKKPGQESHVLHTLGWSLHLTNVTLSFDVKSENIFYGKTRIECGLESGHCPPNHAIKATVIRKPNNHCQNFDVGISYARMIKFQKRYFIDVLADNEINSGHQHNAYSYNSHFQDHLYDE